MNHEPICVRPREAAKLLGISQRLLWELTQPRGPIPCVKLGKSRRAPVLYAVEELRRWARQQSRQQTEGCDERE